VIVTLKVRRFRGGESYVQEYRVDVRDLRTTVLDLLIKVKDNFGRLPGIQIRL
jgi:succinate dehydrogenase subunit B (EC 1.3.5.1)